MSAWLCGNGTLSLVVDTIKSREFQKYDTENYRGMETMELLKLLSDLNTKSLNCRYGKSTHHILQDKKYLPLKVEDGQRHKSVHCYLYQTCECEENWNHPLFKALEQWSEDNDEKYEENWNKYHWDIDNIIL